MNVSEYLHPGSEAGAIGRGVWREVIGDVV
jgi:hypothetical protein